MVKLWMCFEECYLNGTAAEYMITACGSPEG